VDEQPGAERPPLAPDTRACAGARDVRDGASRPGVPRWVMAFAAIGLVLVVMAVIMLLTGHGPGQHLQGLTHSPTGPVTAAAGPRVPRAWS
jgi:hypothetical protein